MLRVFLFLALVFPLTAVGGTSMIPHPDIGDRFLIQNPDERSASRWVTYKGFAKKEVSEGQVWMLFFESSSRADLLPAHLFQVLAGEHAGSFVLDGVMYTFTPEVEKPEPLEDCVGHVRRVSAEEEFPGSLSGVYCYSPEWNMITGYHPETDDNGFSVIDFRSAQQ